MRDDPGTFNPSPPDEPTGDDRLDSWKEIAAYLKRDVRTAQRWEKKEGLPVHRHIHSKLGTVHAYKAEVDAWWRNGREHLEAAEPNLRAPWLSRCAHAVGFSALLFFVAILVWKHPWRLAQTRGAARISGLVVLPLQNLSGDPKEEYFVDGMTEELIGRLSGIKSLKVISWTSAMHYMRTGKPPAEIARELNVDGVLEGWALSSGERVRVSINLVHAPTDEVVWGETYDRPAADLVALQDELAWAIANELRLELSSQEKARLSRVRPVDPQVQDAYLRGRYYWNKRTESDLKRAIEYFRQALDIDPTYAPAYAGLADCYSLLSVWGTLPSQEAFAKAKKAALKALELDQSLTEAHVSLAFCLHRYDWNWRDAQGEFRRAIELNPNDATAHQWYGEFLGDLGRHAEGIPELRKARELDPLSSIITSDLALGLLKARQYESAEREVKRLLAVDPNFPPAHAYLAGIYAHEGRFDRAISELDKDLSLTHGNPTVKAWLGHIYALFGRKEQVRRVVRELAPAIARGEVSPLQPGRNLRGPRGQGHGLCLVGEVIRRTYLVPGYSQGQPGVGLVAFGCPVQGVDSPRGTPHGQ